MQTFFSELTLATHIKIHFDIWHLGSVLYLLASDQHDSKQYPIPLTVVFICMLPTAVIKIQLSRVYMPFSHMTIQDMGSASERRRYIVTSSLIGWAHTKNGQVESKKTMFHGLVSNKLSHKTVPHTWAHVVPLHHTVQNSHSHLSVHVAQYRLYILLTMTRAGQRVVPCVKAPQPRDHCNMHNGLGGDHCTSWYTSQDCCIDIVQLCNYVIMWTQVVTKQYPRINL